MRKKSLIIVIALIFGICTLFVNGLEAKGFYQANEPVPKIEGKTYYASPNGLSGATGLSESEAKDVYSAFALLKEGDTLYLAPGVYKCNTRITLDQSGNAFSKISVIASSKTEKTIFDFSAMKFDSGNRGIQINGDYWYFYGIDMTKAGDNGLYIAGNHNYIEMCEFYENRDSGLQLGRGSSYDTTVSSWPSYNIVKNCTSYNNYDDETYGENADGFAAKLTVGYGNVFDGCIAYRNSDDGWDLYAKSDTGNVGTVIILNCAAFENGWLLNGSTTRDGDGIGFKLGGSNMEGDVIISNCMAWNNRLHGFSDNSNPKTISISNCTSYNNSVTVINGLPSYSDGSSTNFNLARNNESYNNYFGLLSYCTNMTASNIEYEGGDDYVGSAGFCIFNTSKGVYTAITDYMDASVYEKEKIGTTYSGLSDSSFANLTFDYDTTEYNNLHKKLRNSDGSINLGDMLEVVDEKLLVFANGEQIGAKLNQESWNDYSHYNYREPKLNSTEDEISVLSAYDALEVMCNKVAVYQDVTLLTNLNNCKISWETSDEKILSIGTTSYSSYSAVSYVIGTVYRSRYNDLDVILKATITCNDAKLIKEFKLHLIKDNPKLGQIIGCDDTYIVDLYSKYSEPVIKVTNKNSYSGQALKLNVDYGIKKIYEYSETKTGEFNQVSKVYTSVPGVYKVTYIVKSFIDQNDSLTCSYLVYVVSPTAEIDFINHEGYKFYVCKGGVHIIGNLSNVSGNMYAYLSTNSEETVDSVIKNGKKYLITTDYIDVLAENENNSKYYIHVVVENKAGSYKSAVYTEEVTIEEITTCQEFYDMANSKTSSVVIYLLKNNLDFSNFTWKETSNTNTFDGLFNGNGYTISNLTINGSSNKNCNIFYKLNGGTIMNVKFTNIKLMGNLVSSQYVGIVGQMVGGYLHNISINNITATGFQSVGGLIAKVCGENNYFTQISVINDYEFDEKYNLKENHPYFTVTTKYLGGIIGNVQKDTSESIVKVYMSDCYADCYVGTGKDSGGYIGGLIGRVKNDFDVCSVTVYHSMFDGVVETSKNYAGGIIAGCDNGAGFISVSYCVSRPVIIYGSVRSIIDGVTYDSYGILGIAVKNGSPIIGRYTAGSGYYEFICNYATFADYNSVVGSIAGDEDLTDENVYFNIIQFNKNIWEYNELSKGIRLIFLNK